MPAAACRYVDGCRSGVGLSSFVRFPRLTPRPLNPLAPPRASFISRSGPQEAQFYLIAPARPSPEMPAENRHVHRRDNPGSIGSGHLRWNNGNPRTRIRTRQTTPWEASVMYSHSPPNARLVTNVPAPSGNEMR